MNKQEFILAWENSIALTGYFSYEMVHTDTHVVIRPNVKNHIVATACCALVFLIFTAMVHAALKNNALSILVSCFFFVWLLLSGFYS